MGRKQKLLATAVFLILIMAAAACTAPSTEDASSGPDEDSNSGTVIPLTEEGIMVDLPDMGDAPEFLNEVWLNSDGPVTLAGQRGKVVLLAFWTFG